MKRVFISAVLLVVVLLNFSNPLMARLPGLDGTPLVEISTVANQREFALGSYVQLNARYLGASSGAEEYAFYVNEVRLASDPVTFWLPASLGIYDITCVVTLPNGQTLTSDPLQLRISHAPVISLVDPKQSVRVFSPAFLDLEVAASDSDGVVRRVRFFQGTNQLGVVEAPPYRLRVGPLNFPLPLKAVAEDDSGLTSEVEFPVTVVGMPGDDFYRPFELTGEHAKARVSNRDATDQVADAWPEIPSNAGHKSMWWTWTAPAAGTAMISTEGSNFNTVLGVLVRTNTANVVTYNRLLTSRDGAGVGPASLAKFRVLQGTEYRIVVDAESGNAGGDIQLALDFVRTPDHFAPQNDSLALRQRLNGRVVEQTFNSLAASLEPGERNILTNISGGKSVWFEWVPTSTGIATITTRGSQFDTILGVYGGASDAPDVARLTLLLANDDDPEGGSHSTVWLPVNSGNRLLIVVDGFSGEGGDGILKINLEARSPNNPPINGSVANRIRLTSDALIQRELPLGIKFDTNAPPILSRALWWSWTPTVDQTVFVTTAGSSQQTRLGIYSLDEAGRYVKEALSTSPLDIRDRGNQSEALIVAVSGREYLIGVGEDIFGQGMFQLQVISGPPLHGLPLSSNEVDVAKGVQTVSLGLETPRKVLLMASPDLVNWQVIRTNTFQPGSKLSVPLTSEGAGFLKAYEWNYP